MWDAAFGAYKEKASGRWSSYYTSQSDVRTSEYVFIPRMWDAPLARIRRNHRKLVFKLCIAKRCPYNWIRFLSPACRDAPLARIRRMPHEDGFHIIHRKAMSVQGNTFGSVHTSARIRRKPQEVGLQIIHRKAMSVQMNTFFVIMIAIKIGIGVGLSIKMCNFAF